MSSRKKILIVQPDNPQLRLLLIPMKRAVALLKAELEAVSTVEFATADVDPIYTEVEAADLIVVDVTDSAPASMYLFGYAHARGTPVVVMYESAARVAFDVSGVPAIRYDLESQEGLIEAFRRAVEDALSYPARYKRRLKSGSPGTSVFISYSHKDERFLLRLRVHLRPLERDQRIELWDDTKIKAGQHWQGEITAALRRSKAAILLISADFLASEFIVSNELPTILQRAALDNTLILPLIVSPCGFLRDPNLSRYQAVNDPAKTIAELPDVEQERMFDKVREIIESFGPGAVRGTAADLGPAE